MKKWIKWKDGTSNSKSTQLSVLVTLVQLLEIFGWLLFLYQLWWQFERHQWQSSNPTSEITDPNESSAWGGSQWRVNWNSAGEQIVSLYKCATAVLHCPSVQHYWASQHQRTLYMWVPNLGRLTCSTAVAHFYAPSTSSDYSVAVALYPAPKIYGTADLVLLPFLRISVVFFQWNFAGVPRVCPPLIRQTIQLPRPHRKRKLDVTRPATAPRKIVTNKQRWPKIIQRNAVGQLTLKNVWKTKILDIFKIHRFNPKLRGKHVKLMFYLISVCIRSF